MTIDINEKKLSIRSNYRPDIDGLRAFAVVTVIINHFNKDILPGGYLGVDIFFVISGFVITSSLYQRPCNNFKDFISGFYERRIRRIFPALSIFVLVMSIAISLFNPTPNISLRTGLTSLFGLSNLYLFKNATNYFATSTEINVFTHTWSLGVEEQFYILFPFLIYISGFGRQTKKGTRNLFLTVGILTIASLIGFLWLYPKNETAAYFLMPTRLWEMASGCLLFIKLKKRSRITQILEMFPSLLVVTLIIIVMFLPMSLAAGSTVAVVILSAMLIASLKEKSKAYKLFTNKKVVYIGLISYSLYLWHWGILSISRWTIGIHWWTVPFQIGLILSLAITSYKYIEKPLRTKNWFNKRWEFFSIGGGVLVTLSGCLLMLDQPLIGKLFIGSQYNKWNMKVYRVEKKTIFNPRLPTIYLLGDSHIGHYGAVITHLESKKDFNFVMHPQGHGLKLQNKSFDEFILAPVREYKNKFKKGDIIVFSAYIDKYQKPHNWIKQYETIIQKTKNIQMKYVLISPTPSFPEIKVKYRFDCQKEWFRPSWKSSAKCIDQINKKEWFESNNETITKIKRFVSQNPKVSYLDAFSILCPDTYCKNLDQNVPMYIDQNHLSSYGAMKISNTFETMIRTK